MNSPIVRRARRRLPLVVASLGLLLASCAEKAPQDTLEPEGPVARQIDNLFKPVFWIAVGVFVIVQGALLFAAVRFRRSKLGEDHVPEQTHGNTRMEIGWTIAPAALLAVIAVPTVSTIIDLSEEKPGSEQVTVYGAQWWWEYEYANGAVTANELHVPVGTPVLLTMTSRDVIHSYWVPKLGGKKDVVPGRWHTLTIEATEPGEYFGQCVEFCGASHANMRLRVIAQEPAEYEAWLEDQLEEADEPAAGSLEAQGQELITARGCTSCHVLRGISTADQIAALRGDRLIRAKGDTVPFAPDLTHVAARGTFAGSLFDLDRENLASWLRNPPGVKDGSLMPNLGLSDADVNALVAYLLSLD